MRKRGARFTRRIDPLAAFRSAGRQHQLDDSQKLRLGVALRTHPEAIRTGKADAYAFHTLAGAVNVSMVLAEPLDHPELHGIIGAAQEAIQKLRSNGNGKSRWILDGTSLQALMAWLSRYEAQLEACSQQEAMNALDEVKRRIARGMVINEDERKAA